MKNLIILILFFCPYIIHSQLLELTEFSSGFFSPVDIANAGDDRLFVVEKGGFIRLVDADGNVADDPFLNIDPVVNSGASERGLLGLAFHPDFANNGFFFVNYTRQDGSTVVSRFTAEAGANVVDPATEEIIIVIEQPFNNHNGGDLNFGPDGYLYIGMGDGGSSGDPLDLSQNPMSLLGKMLRIDVDNGLPYTIPESNPFAADDFVSDEIWAFGLRNPWRFSFDRLTGDMWIGDVGQNRWEEVDFQEASSTGGENYGWRCYEAEQAFNTTGCDGPEAYDAPVFFYANDDIENGCSITGGFVYRGSMFPYLTGKYIFCDFCSGQFWFTEKSGSEFETTKDFRGSPLEYSSFGENSSGELFVAAIGEGKIYRVGTVCQLEIMVDSKMSSCESSNDGSIELSFSNEMGDITINWDNGVSGPSNDNLMPGTYCATISDNGVCDYEMCYDILSVETSDYCNGDLTEINICEGDMALLEACENPEGFWIQWYLNGELIEGANENPISQNEEGVYSVNYQHESCETATFALYNLSVESKPIAEFTYDEETKIATATEGFVIYQWYLDGELVQESDNNSFQFDVGSANLSLIVISGSGCISDESDPLFISSNSDIQGISEAYLSPNPSSGIIRLNNLDPMRKYDIQVVSMDGKSLGEWRCEFAGFMEIDLNDFKDGTYILVLKNIRGSKSMTFSILK